MDGGSRHTSPGGRVIAFALAAVLLPMTFGGWLVVVDAFADGRVTISLRGGGRLSPASPAVALLLFLTVKNTGTYRTYLFVTNHCSTAFRRRWIGYTRGRGVASGIGRGDGVIARARPAHVLHNMGWASTGSPRRSDAGQLRGLMAAWRGCLSW